MPQQTINRHYFFSVTNVPISFFERRSASSMRIGSSFTNLSQNVKHQNSDNVHTYISWTDIVSIGLDCSVVPQKPSTNIFCRQTPSLLQNMQIIHWTSSFLHLLTQCRGKWRHTMKQYQYMYLTITIGWSVGWLKFNGAFNTINYNRQAGRHTDPFNGLFKN